jgi:Protein of unknown function (DUF1553)/Protein of unknown function (DUF1549)/Planctomycete cytochrome C
MPMNPLFNVKSISLAMIATAFAVVVSFFTPTGMAQQTSGLTTDQLEFFEKSVRPLLIERCYECHSAKEVSGGLRLDSQVGVAAGGDSGPAIVVGQPSQSRLIEAIRYENRDLQMPPNGRLSDAEISALVKWIELGAPDPRDTVPIAAPQPTGMSIEDGRNFWSMQPVAAPVIPQVTVANWVSTPLDNFVLAKLESKGLRPAEMADQRTLIRRVTQDLIGLPPTEDEIAEFVADTAPDAYSRLVDRLLASPQYGVRWGRHWLDVARYADSNGLDENLALGNAWRYRDYVVDAFNANKPFDRFLMEQLAGDLVAGANRQTVTATGYLVLGAKVLAEPDREKLVMDTIDEQIDATGKAFLGLTLGCARCHDHKFDPIKQVDYYALAAIFKSTQTFGPTNTGAIKHWNEHSFATAEELEKLKAVEAEIAAKNAVASKYKGEAVAKIRDAAKAKAADYLAAASELAPTATLKEVAAVAAPLGLHPRILHHCRLHLEYHRDDSVFVVWHLLNAERGTLTSDSAGAPCDADELAISPNSTAEAIREHYLKLFAEVEQALAEAQKTKTESKPLEDARLEQARQALHDASGFLAIPPQPEFAFDDATLAEYYRLMDEARIVESVSPDETSAMGVADGKVQTSIPIHVRGSHRNLGELVSRNFPIVIQSTSGPPIFAKHQSGRLEFAHWMASTQNPLTARVFVNRLWRWHFGRGLVASTENFGQLGDRPSHPELLDFLARQFMESSWSIKELQRSILMSSAYRMQSTHVDEAACATIDPENVMLWKFRMQRLDAEQIRDAVLSVAGRLDDSIGGKSVPLRNRQFVFNHTSVDHTRYESLRRAAYLPVIRNNLYTLFEQFDFPDPTMPTGNRNATVVAPQALLLMNDDLVLDSAREFAEVLIRHSNATDRRVELAYERALGRKPTLTETERALAFVEKWLAADLQAATEDKDAASDEVVNGEAQRTAWAMFCHSLMASNEFIYIK